jgi:hypothetical protein
VTPHRGCSGICWGGGEGGFKGGSQKRESKDSEDDFRDFCFGNGCSRIAAASFSFVRLHIFDMDEKHPSFRLCGNVQIMM